MVYPMKKEQKRAGRTLAAYKRQPQAKKWPCFRCGKVEVIEKNRKKGEPRLQFKAEFATAFERDLHTAREHS